MQHLKDTELPGASKKKKKKAAEEDAEAEEEVKDYTKDF